MFKLKCIRISVYIDESQSVTCIQGIRTLYMYEFGFSFKRNDDTDRRSSKTICILLVPVRSQILTQ